MKMLGIDYGEKRIGLAVSDELGLMAHGHGIINNTGEQEVLAQIARLIQQENITTIVVGLPKNMNDTIGAKAKEVLDFVGRLQTQLKISVVTWDERLTTHQAEMMLREMNLSRQKKRKQLNVVAAQLILQEYLEANRKPESKGLLPYLDPVNRTEFA